MSKLTAVEKGWKIQLCRSHTVPSESGVAQGDEVEKWKQRNSESLHQSVFGANLH